MFWGGGGGRGGGGGGAPGAALGAGGGEELAEEFAAGLGGGEDADPEAALAERGEDGVAGLAGGGSKIPGAGGDLAGGQAEDDGTRVAGGGDEQFAARSGAEEGAIAERYVAGESVAGGPDRGGAPGAGGESGGRPEGGEVELVGCVVDGDGKLGRRAEIEGGVGEERERDGLGRLHEGVGERGNRKLDTRGPRRHGHGAGERGVVGAGGGVARDGVADDDGADAAGAENGGAGGDGAGLVGAGRGAAKGDAVAGGEAAERGIPVVDAGLGGGVERIGAEEELVVVAQAVAVMVEVLDRDAIEGAAGGAEELGERARVAGVVAGGEGFLVGVQGRAGPGHGHVVPVVAFDMVELEIVGDAALEGKKGG